MSASEHAQALHYRQQVEALFDDYAPDFEAIHHVDNASVAGPSSPAGGTSRSPRRWLLWAPPR